MSEPMTDEERVFWDRVYVAVLPNELEAWEKKGHDAFEAAQFLADSALAQRRRRVGEGK